MGFVLAPICGYHFDGSIISVEGEGEFDGVVGLFIEISEVGLDVRMLAGFFKIGLNIIEEGALLLFGLARKGPKMG